MSTKYCFAIPDVSCPACAVAIINTLTVNPSLWERIFAFFTNKKNSSGLTFKQITSNDKSIHILDVKVNTSYKQITLTIEENDIPAAEVMALLNEALDQIGFHCSQPISQAQFATTPSTINSRWFTGFAGVGSGLLLLILPLITGPLPLIAMTIIAVPSVALTLFLGAESYIKATKLLLNGALNMDSLFAISTLVALGASIAAFFFPGFPMMFETGLIIFGFRHIGQAIRESLEQRMELTQRFQDRTPRFVKKQYPDTTFKMVPSDSIQPDDVICIAAGELIAVDGICETGSATIDRSIEYGSSKEPVPLRPGARISAGTILLAGSITLRATAPVHLSLLARKDASIANSLNDDKKTSWATEAETALYYFIPIVLGIAVLSGIFIGLFFPITLAVQCMIAVMVSACPCTLGLVTGLTVQVGMKKAMEHHIEFKSTRKLEEIDQITRVVFDVNGTLTTSEPEVIEAFHIHDTDCTYENFLSYALLLEQSSTKSIGMAIYNYAKTKITPSTIPMDVPIDTSNHSGVQTMIDGAHYRLGNQDFMQEHAILLASYQASHPHRPLDSDETILYLARDNRIMGHFIVRRPLRPEAKDVIDAIRKMGKEVYICTGSSEDVALRYAKALKISIDNVRYGMTSEEKVNYIKTLQENNKYGVAMIGDEENDTDPIAASDFGVAMPVDGLGNMNHHVSAAQMQMCSLEPLVAAFEISKQTTSNIRKNLIFSWSYNTFALLLPIILVLTTGIAISPGVCAALMIIQTAFVLLNTYWFKQQPLVCLKNARDENALHENSSYSKIHTMMPEPTRQVHPRDPLSEGLVINDTTSPTITETLPTDDFSNASLSL